jgi:hypothetical protein
MKNLVFYLALTISIVLLPSFSAIARTNPAVKGRVIENYKGTPLGFATIAVQNNEKRVVGGATTTDDGEFIIDKLDKGSYSLKVSFIGFRDTLIEIQITDAQKTVNLGELKLSEDAVTMKSAIVTAKVPIIEQKLDKIIMNISESSIALGSNATEIIRRAPGITVDSDGNLLLNGKPVEIWIDGRPSNLNGSALESLLESTDGSTIDKIEVIAHPSAKYDAAGSGGIINIRTKKNFARGISGSIRGTAHAGFYDKTYPAADGSLTLGYRGEKSNTTISYSPRVNKAFNSFKSTTQFNDDRRIESFTHYDRFAYSHNLRISSDYSINKNNIVGFIINGNLSRQRDTSNDKTENRLYFGNNLAQRTKTHITNSFSYNNASLNLNYTHIFKEGTEITANADYYHYFMPDGNTQENLYEDATGTPILTPTMFRNNSDQLVKIYSAKTDFESNIGDKMKLESGLKYAMSVTDNSLLREDFINGEWIKNSYISSDFKYRESISAAYASLAFNVADQINIKAGLRGELTQATGDWISADTITNKSYLDIFPTLFIGYNPSKNTRLSFSYTKRVQRPNFEQLNPQRFYIDSESSLTGNPDILPQYTSNFNLSAGVGKHLNFGIRADISNKAIVQNTSVDSITGEKMFVWENFGKNGTIGGTISVTEYPITKWLTATCNLFSGKMYARGDDYTDDRFFFHGNLRTTFLLPLNFKLELSGFYQSKIKYGHLLVKPRADITVGLRKNFLNNNATISLVATDLLKTHVSRVSTTNNPDFKYDIDVNYRSQRVSLTFVYRYGQSKQVKSRKVGISDEAGRVSTRN